MRIPEQYGKVMEVGYTGDGKPMAIPLEAMRKHFVCFGSSGSGKTVLGKILVEEFTRKGVPTIVVDPQGDLASLGLFADQTSLVAHAADLEGAKEYADRAEVRIFTPASSKGIPLRVELFRMPDKDLPVEERVNALDMTASSIVQLLDYDHESSRGKSARKFLYLILKTIDEQGKRLEDISELVELVRDPAQVALKPGRVIKTKDRETLAIDLGHLTIGVDELLFTHGVGMTMDTLLEPVQQGRVPVNIIYLNTLNTDRHKHFFVANLCKEIYSWMLKNPRPEVQLAFYIDEVGPFMPPDPRNPPAKQLLKLLYKQGRKYGVSMLMCTQNIADIEYKAVAQASTWALGRLMANQDLGKVKHLIRSLPQEEYNAIMATLPKLKACNFSIISSDVFKGTVQLRARWLFTEHRTLDEDSIKGAMRPEVVDHFQDPLKMAPGDDVRPFVPVEEGGADGTDPFPATVQDDLAPGQPLDEAGDVDGAAVDEEGFDPERRFIYVADVKVPQAEASKRLLDWGKDLIRKGEEVREVQTEYLLLWRVRIKTEVQEGMIPFLAKKIMKENNIYIEGSRNLPTSGQLMQVERTVRFTNVTSKKAHEIVDLDDNTEFSVIELKELPFNVHKVPALTRKEVERIVYNLFGVNILKARRVIYRVWRFTVRDRETGKERFVRIDSVFGRPVSIL